MLLPSMAPKWSVPTLLVIPAVLRMNAASQVVQDHRAAQVVPEGVLPVAAFLVVRGGLLLALLQAREWLLGM